MNLAVLAKERKFQRGEKSGQCILFVIGRGYRVERRGQKSRRDAVRLVVSFRTIPRRGSAKRRFFKVVRPGSRELRIPRMNPLSGRILAKRRNDSPRCVSVTRARCFCKLKSVSRFHETEIPNIVDHVGPPIILTERKIFRRKSTNALLESSNVWREQKLRSRLIEKPKCTESSKRERVLEYHKGESTRETFRNYSHSREHSKLRWNVFESLGLRRLYFDEGVYSSRVVEAVK